MLGLSLGREYRDRVSSAVAALWRGNPIYTASNQTLDPVPSSTLSDYVFAVESSGYSGVSGSTTWADWLATNPPQSKIWVIDTSSDNYNPTVWSWSPPTSDIPDFYEANEIIVNGNDIFVVYHWTQVTGTGSNPYRADNKVAKFSNCTVDTSTTTISYTSVETVTCTGQGNIHGVTRDSDYIWMVSRTSYSVTLSTPETPLGRINLSGSLQYDKYTILDSQPDVFGDGVLVDTEVDVWAGENITNYGDYLFMPATSRVDGSFKTVLARISKDTKEAVPYLVLEPNTGLTFGGDRVYPQPWGSQGKIITISEKNDTRIDSQSVTQNSDWESVADAVHVTTNEYLDQLVGEDQFGYVNRGNLHAVYLDESTDTFFWTTSYSPKVSSYNLNTDTQQTYWLPNASDSQPYSSTFRPEVTTEWLIGFTDDFAYKDGHLYLGVEDQPPASATGKGIWVLRLSDGAYQQLTPTTYQPFAVTHPDMQI